MRVRSICLLLLLASAAAQAQSRIGFSLGGDFGSDVLFRAALPAEVALGPTFSLRPELAFTQRKSLALIQNLDRERRYFSATMTYLEIPVLLKAELRVRSWSLFGLFGPAASFGLRAAAWYRESGRIKTEQLS